MSNITLSRDDAHQLLTLIQPAYRRTAVKLLRLNGVSPTRVPSAADGDSDVIDQIRDQLLMDPEEFLSSEIVCLFPRCTIFAGYKLLIKYHGNSKSRLCMKMISDALIQWDLKRELVITLSAVLQTIIDEKLFTGEIRDLISVGILHDIARAHFFAAKN